MTGRKNKLITIKCIASALGVSVSTVSRALQGHSKVSAETKRKVKNYALQNGYEPNTQALNLRLKRSYTIAVIVPCFTDPFFAEAIDAIELAARRCNYNVLLGRSNNSDIKEAELFHSMRMRRVDGILISVSSKSVFFKKMDLASVNTLPVVFFDRVPGITAVCTAVVNCDSYHGMEKMMAWFFQNNRRHIGLINGPSDLLMSKDVLRAYMHAWPMRRRKIDMQLVETTDLTREGNRAAMMNLLKQNCKLDAVISFNDNVHTDVVEIAAEKGVEINGDIFFGSCEGRSFSKYLKYPPIVSLNPLPAKQGQYAFNALLQQINNGSNLKEYGHKKITSVFTQSKDTIAHLHIPGSTCKELQATMSY